MYTCPIELSEVRYNAAEQCYEALVTVHDNAVVRRYSCAIAAPISMSFQDAAKGLARQAIRRHQRHDGLFSETLIAAPKSRSERPGLNPVRWLENLITYPVQKAA